VGDIKIDLKKVLLWRCKLDWTSSRYHQTFM